MVCNQSTSNASNQPASATRSVAASAQHAYVMQASGELDEQSASVAASAQHAYVMQASGELDEQPAKAGCFAWVRCCCRRLWQRLRKRKRSRRLRVSLPHGETGAEHHDGAAPPPLAANTEMEEAGLSSEGAGNTHANTAPTDTILPVLYSAQQNFKPLAEHLNRESTSPRTGFISVITVRVAWETTDFACTRKHHMSSTTMQLKVRTVSNTVKTICNHEHNETIAEEHENKHSLHHLNNEGENNKQTKGAVSQTANMQGNHLTADTSKTSEEQTQRTKRTRRHRRKKKKTSQTNEERETKLMEEKEATTILPEPTLEQEQEEKMRTMEEEMETENKQSLEERNEETHDIFDEEVCGALPSVKEQTVKICEERSKPEQMQRTKRHRRHRRKKNKTTCENNEEKKTNVMEEEDATLEQTQKRKSTRSRRKNKKKCEMMRKRKRM